MVVRGYYLQNFHRNLHVNRINNRFYCHFKRRPNDSDHLWITILIKRALYKDLLNFKARYLNVVFFSFNNISKIKNIFKDLR